MRGGRREGRNQNASRRGKQEEEEEEEEEEKEVDQMTLLTFDADLNTF